MRTMHVTSAPAAHTRSASAPALLTGGLLTIQGLYFAVTGVWPLVHLESLEAVTGPKTDHWLVQTVGVLITVIGAVLLLAAYRRRLSAEVVLLAVGSAAALAAVDVVFVGRGVIPPIYLLDAAAEAVLIA